MLTKGKKIMCLFAIMAVMLIFSGCGSNKDNENNNETVETSEPAENKNNDGESEPAETENEGGESESVENESTDESSETFDSNTDGSEGENSEIVLGYKFDVSSNWKLAYADTSYIYYYMMETSETYDSNVVLSVTSDEGLAGVDIEELEKSFKNQYGENAIIEKGTTKENGEKMIYVEVEQMNGDIKARIGQYVVVGEKKAVIFSVYSEDSKFETAKKYAGYVVNTISFEK